jgi:molybdenum cofactor synthesis domain-containing protein
MAARVAAIVIGNEVLTAKVTEANGAYLIRRLRERGVELEAVHFVRDDVDVIVEQLTAARKRARHIVTSGGVGPTHDDVTVRAVALALGRRIVRLPEIEARLRAHYGERPMPEAALRMAEAPEGSALLSSADTRFPVLVCEEIYMLPGVPQFFRLHLEAVLQRLPGVPVVLRQLFLDRGESEIAAALDAVALAAPEVAIGSYPTWGDDVDHRVRLTIEHVDAARVEAAVAALREKLPPGAILREG